MFILLYAWKKVIPCGWLLFQIYSGQITFIEEDKVAMVTDYYYRRKSIPPPPYCPRDFKDEDNCPFIDVVRWNLHFIPCKKITQEADLRLVWFLRLSDQVSQHWVSCLCLGLLRVQEDWRILRLLLPNHGLQWVGRQRWFFVRVLLQAEVWCMLQCHQETKENYCHNV